MTNTPEYFSPLIQLYQDMDNAWNQVAQQYGFQCNGCTDNCCLSLFFHHTHAEASFLEFGLQTLPRKDQMQVLALSRDYCRQTFSGPANNHSRPASQKIPCPLLKKNMCSLYNFRPMICRLHGLPHELHKPGFNVIKGPGCDAGKFDGHEYIPFDRTPFYKQMAIIEMNFRQLTGKTGKIKKTIAQIFVDSESFDYGP
ncbi:YkgJ family cysteine cluster protein [Desulfobacter latus]|uniref:YkgJ family cysteine cluster protein n=1 Tax=Desulfobacter latus TaxID=2292 RepID=A0A850SWD6_9BACT|nr:YkgJ family cysteine cluster protein [Desulfobacter latus]NWH03733.1 YkgJ family cysteine cluster protein [Desulfobacter latus]